MHRSEGTRPTHVICVIVFLCTVQWTVSMYVPPTVEHSDLHKGSTAASTDSCSGDSSCQNSVPEVDCEPGQFCSLQCKSGSRMVYPTRSSLVDNACEGDPPQDVPPEVPASSGHFFTNASTNEQCTVNTTQSAKSDTGNFAISFWLQGSCSPKCSIIRFGALTVNLNANKLEVNNMLCSTCTTTSGQWRHFVITRRLTSKDLDVFMDSVKQSISPSLEENIQNTIAVLGPSVDPTGSDEYTVLDPRFYEDGLTTREIKGIFTATFPTTPLLSNCRCPVAKPDISSDGLTCNGEKRLTKIFTPITALLDADTNTRWISEAKRSVVVTVDFQNSFQIKQISVTYTDPKPTSTKVELYSENRWATADSRLYTCNVNGCSKTSTNISNYADFSKTVGSRVRLTFTYASSSHHVINDVTISGWCDCDGSATNCTKTSGSADYTCGCGQRTRGDNCKSCTNGLYRKTDGFGCTDTCNCLLTGVDDSDICESVGGACKCKTNVQGARCDTCKRLYYKLEDSNPDGCRRSSCDDIGSVDCNKSTGICECKSNVEGTDCDTCAVKHFWTQSKTGCEACDCETAGTVGANDFCNVASGQCFCKSKTQGRQCDECKDDYHSLDSSSTEGCSPCNCNDIGTTSPNCNKTTGQCPCRGDDFTNLQCEPIVNPPDPGFGPIGGGTTVAIRGNYMDKSPRITIRNVNQDITKKNDTYIEIRTGVVNSPASETMEISLAGQPFKDHEFIYKPNPVVATSEIPSSALASKSGGCRIDIKGDYLNSVAYPRMKFTFGSTEETTVCKHVGTDGKMMQCPTPDLSALSTDGTNGSVDLILDGVNQTEISTVITTEDSTVDQKDYEFAPPFEKTIIITGKNLGSDCSESDYQIYVGSENNQCHVTSFTQAQIECEPPKTQPIDAQRLYDLKLRIGLREITVGEIDYKPFWLTNYFVYIMVGCGLFLIIVIVIVCCICCRRCRRQTGMNPNPPSNPLTHANGRESSINLIPAEPKTIIHPFENKAYTPHEPLDTSPNADEVVTSEFFLHRVEESIRGTVKASIIGESSFRPGNLCLAKGNHARMIDGTFTARSTVAPNKKITIKMLKNPLPESGVLTPTYTTALRECLRLKTHRDDHVLSIHGIGLDKHRFYIIYPYMEKKTLKDQISDSQNSFVLRQLLEFALQVCEGMDYLASRDIVHKDIAARNCMVDAQDQVKLSDSAFSWDFYPEDYMYDSVKDRYLPVRWMAPESLTAGFYDTKSDVWSFGVLMWELLTRGSSPFHELRDTEVKQYVNDGYRLGKPPTISDDVYESMNSCWSVDEERRPSFFSLQQQLDSSLTNRQTMNEDLYVNAEQLDGSYVNEDEIHRLRKAALSRRH